VWVNQPTAAIITATAKGTSHLLIGRFHGYVPLPAFETGRKSVGLRMAESLT